MSQTSTGTSGGFLFRINHDFTDGDLIAIDVGTPSGKQVRLWSEVEINERTLILHQFYIFGIDAGPGDIGLRGLREMARAALEQLDVDCIRIEGARWTSGASPGRTVEAIEFRRRAR